MGVAFYFEFTDILFLRVNGTIILDHGFFHRTHLLFLVQRYPDHHQFILELLAEPVQIGNTLPTRTERRSPEINQHELTFRIRHFRQPFFNLQLRSCPVQIRFRPQLFPVITLHRTILRTHFLNLNFRLIDNRLVHDLHVTADSFYQIL